MSDGLGTNVCVIGAGALGLAAVKNLLEQSFTVTAYERSSSVGGLWRTSSNSTQTTALEGTISNISKIGVRL